jgi:RND family efflux transporter MFP subunit
MAFGTGSKGATAAGRLRIMVLAGLAVALAACSEEKKVEAPDPVRPVKVTEISGPDRGRMLVYSGSVKARTEMNLGFRVAGKMTERLVDVGDKVTPGMVLARLDATDLQLAVRQAEADVSASQKQADISELAFRRAQTLNAKAITSQSELEQASLTRDKAVASLESAVSALDQARNQAAYTELTSDKGGIVTEVSADRGQVVSAGTPIVTVAVDGAKEVLVAVPEGDIAQFQPGKAVKARFWSSADLVLDGKVREVAGSADAQSRTFSIRVSVPEDPRVLLGMTATIEVQTENVLPACSIPLAALAKKDDQPVVWVVNRESGKVASRPITVADFSDEGVRVTKGLAAGDLVVSAGTQFMKDDMTVRLPETVSSRFGNVNSLSTASVRD